MTISYCLKFETPPTWWDRFRSPRNRVAQLYPQASGSLFVASYDSQGYGGGIRTRLHAVTTSPRYIAPERTAQRTSIIACFVVTGKQHVHSCSLATAVIAVTWQWVYMSHYIGVCTHQWVSGVLSPGLKHLEREAGCSPPSSADAKNGLAIPPLSVERRLMGSLRCLSGSTDRGWQVCPTFSPEDGNRLSLRNVVPNGKDLEGSGFRKIEIFCRCFPGRIHRVVDENRTAHFLNTSSERRLWLHT
jgi:hypothetical protein